MRHLMQCLNPKRQCPTWTSVSNKVPVACPSCRSRKVKVVATIEGKKYHCERCGNDWDAYKGKRPVVCPGCHSPYWDRPKKEKRENVKITN